MLSEEVSGTTVDYENSLAQQIFTSFIFISSLILDSRIFCFLQNGESTLLVLVGLMV